MSFEDLLNITVDVYRKTNQLFSGGIEEAAITRTYQLPTGFFLLLTVSKLAGNGTLTVAVTGKVKVAGEDDKEDTEDFEFTSDGFKQGSKEFTNVSGITSTGITSGTLKIESVSSTGAELYDEYLIKEDVKARIAEKKSLITVVIPGGAIRANLKMYCLADADILENDIIVSNSTAGITYIAASVIEVQDYDDVHHKTVDLRPEALAA